MTKIKRGWQPKYCYMCVPHQGFPDSATLFNHMKAAHQARLFGDPESRSPADVHPPTE